MRGPAFLPLPPSPPPSLALAELTLGQASSAGPGIAVGGGGGGGDREVHRGSKGEDSFKDFRYCTNAFGQCTVAAPFAVLDFGKTQVPTEGGRLCDCVHPLTKGTAG